MSVDLCPYNIGIIIANDPLLKDLFFYDTIKQQICFLRAPFWDTDIKKGDGHVWYNFSTSDQSRNAGLYMDQDEVCLRIFSGLSMLYRPSENPSHHEVAQMFKKAWHWLNGGSDEATAIRKAAGALGKSALMALPGLLAL